MLGDFCNFSHAIESTLRTWNSTERRNSWIEHDVHFGMAMLIAQYPKQNIHSYTKLSELIQICAFPIHLFLQLSIHSVYTFI